MAIPKKKTPSKAPKKSQSTSSKVDYSFLGLLILFAAMSLYAIGSYFGSTGDFLDKRYASVVNVDLTDADVVAEKEVFSVFTDVVPGSMSERAIVTLYNHGIVSGYNDGTFRPDNTITRAEFWALMVNATDADISGQVLENCFTDVTTEWFAPYVCYAKLNGFVGGFEDGSYKPNQPVTKAEAIKMALVAFDYQVPDLGQIPDLPYNDTGFADWYTPYAYVASEHGLLKKSVVFSPQYLLTRGDISQVIYNIMNEKELL